MSDHPWFVALGTQEEFHPLHTQGHSHTMTFQDIQEEEESRNWDESVDGDVDTPEAPHGEENIHEGDSDVLQVDSHMGSATHILGAGVYSLVE